MAAMVNVVVNATVPQRTWVVKRCGTGSETTSTLRLTTCHGYVKLQPAKSLRCAAGVPIHQSGSKGGTDVVH
jgi:hypothetical protein